MNQTAYRKWVTQSFIPVVGAIVDFHGPTDVPFTTREMVKHIRRAAADPNYLDADITKLIVDAQARYKEITRCNYLFFDYGERVTNALNVAGSIGALFRKLRSKFITKAHSYITGTNVVYRVHEYTINRKYTVKA